MKTTRRGLPNTISSSAFTLVELLVVILIVSVLAGISFPAYKAIRESNRKKAAEAEIAVIRAKLNDFRLDYGFLPRATFISGTPPGSIREPGIYDAVPDDNYRKASRALFLALTGRTVYDEVEGAKGRDYLAPRRASVGSPAEGPNSNQIFADESDTYEEQSFETGSYLIDPWGNPYGYYYDPDHSRWKSFHTPSSFDFWSTGGKTNATPRSRVRWVTSWAK